MGTIFVNTREPPKSTISPFTMWMAMASYEDHVNPDNVVVYLIDSMNPKIFPLRAYFKKPEVHPEHPDYRLVRISRRFISILLDLSLTKIR